MSKYYKLFSHCIAVSGRHRGAIYNLQKGSIHFVPNSMVQLINLFETTSIRKLVQFVDSKIILKDYISHLKKLDVVFETDRPQNFPALNLDYFSPEAINNAVIEYEFKNYDLKLLINELDQILCKHIELRVVKVDVDLNELVQILKYSENTCFKSIELHLLFSSKITNQQIINLVENYKKIRAVIIHNSYESKLDYDRKIFYLKDNWKRVSNAHFPLDVYVVNVKFFMESQHFNVYYNKKVCINRKGLIKNCLMHKHHFGVYSKEKTINDVLQDKEFKKLWTLKPDLIEDIKDSETRYATLYTQNIESKEGKYYLTD